MGRPSRVLTPLGLVGMVLLLGVLPSLMYASPSAKNTTTPALIPVRVPVAQRHPATAVVKSATPPNATKATTHVVPKPASKVAIPKVVSSKNLTPKATPSTPPKALPSAPKAIQTTAPLTPANAQRLEHTAGQAPDVKPGQPNIAPPLEAIHLKDALKSPKPKVESLTQLVIDETEGLQLLEALMWLKQHHPDLRLARLKVEQSEAKFLASQGAFDPKLKNESLYKRYNSSSGPGKPKESFLTETGVELLTRYGLRLEGGYRSARGDLSPTVQPVGEGGEFYTELLLPLLRGRGVNPFAIAEQRARLQIREALLDLQQKELDLQRKLGVTYWKWMAAGRMVENSQSLLTLAEERQRQVNRRSEAGDLPAIDKVEIQKEVAKRRATLAEDVNTFQQAAFDLSLLLWNQNLSDGAYRILPSWLPKASPVRSPKPVAKTALIEAGELSILKYHPQLLAFPISEQIARLDIDLAKQAFLPRLDAVFGPSVQTGKEAIPGLGIKAGIKLEMPLRNRKGQGDLEFATLELDRIDVGYLQAYQQLRIEVERLIAQMENQYAIYLAADQEWKANEQLQRGEAIKFTFGESTLFVLNIRERETAEAYRKVIKAEQAYHQAVFEYLATSAQL